MNKTKLQGQYAGFMSRLVGFFIDVVIILLVDVVLFLLASALLYQFTGYSVYDCPAPGTFNLRTLTCRITGIGISWFIALFPVVYLLFFWIITGQTLGHYVAGVRVVRTDGRRIKLVTGLLRIAGYILCFLSLGLGFLWILIDNRRQGWHDKLSGSVAIYAWEARQNEKLIERINWRLFKKGEAAEPPSLPDAAGPPGS